MQAPARPGDNDQPAARERSRVAALWQATPRLVRRSLVAVIGLSLVTLGLAMVILPGPFTLPLLLLGFAVLGTEFAWAAAALRRTRRELSRGTATVKRTFVRSAG